MTFSVFISHSSSDKRIADRLVEQLEKANISCWVAPRDIKPGQNYGEAIIKGIYTCPVFVLVFSEKSNRSKHVLKEIERAVNAGCVIIPFRIEEAIPTEAMEYFMSGEQWMDAISRPLDSHITALELTVNRVLGKVDRHELKQPNQEELKRAVDDFQEYAPDQWSGKKKGFVSKVTQLLFGEND